MAAFAPIPNARESTATAVTKGVRKSVRAASLTLTMHALVGRCAAVGRHTTAPVALRCQERRGAPSCIRHREPRGWLARSARSALWIGAGARVRVDVGAEGHESILTRETEVRQTEQLLDALEHRVVIVWRVRHCAR